MFALQGTCFKQLGQIDKVCCFDVAFLKGLVGVVVDCYVQAVECYRAVLQVDPHDWFVAAAICIVVLYMS